MPRVDVIVDENRWRYDYSGSPPEIIQASKENINVSQKLERVDWCWPYSSREWDA
jgi:hypothetical protein